MTVSTKNRIVLFLGFLLITTCFYPAKSMQGKRADEVFSFANQLKKDKLFEAAAQQFLEFATGNPSDPRAPDALEQAADCLFRAGSADEAIQVLETLIETYEKSADLCGAKVRLGRMYFKRDRFADADRVFSDVVTLMQDCPLYPNALLGKGETLIALHKYSAAADLFTAIIQNYIDNEVAARAFFNLAFCQRRLDRDFEALESYSELVRTFPKDPLSAFALIEAARMQASKGDSVTAVERYSEARRFKEKAIFVPATLEGALILEARGNHQLALTWYREVLDLDDLGDTGASPADVYGSAARAAYYAGEYGSVFQMFEQYGERFEGAFSPEVTYYRALADLKRSNYQGAIEDSGILEARAPGSKWAIEAPRIRGEALVAAGNPREGISALRQFVSSAADSAAKCNALERIAGVFMAAVGDTAAALDVMLEKLEVEEKRFPGDILRTGRMFEDAGRYREAARLYEEIIDGFPLTPEMNTAKARLAFIREFTIQDPMKALDSFFDVALEITSMKPTEGRLRLAEARLEILKDSQGVLEMLSDMRSSLRGSPLYAKLLYIEGACYAKMAKKAGLLLNNDAASSDLKKATSSWEELSKQYGNTEWAARAAVDRVLLQTAVIGEADTAAVFRVLTRYPESAARVSLLELLGDYYSKGGTEGAQKRALVYYQQALNLSKEDKSAELELKIAGALSSEKRDAEALEIYKRLYENEEKRTHIQAAYGIGQSLRRLKRYEEAISYFHEVAGETRGDLETRALLQAADCRLVMKQYSEALADYHRVESVTSDPHLRWMATFRIGLCQQRLGHSQEALRAMVACITSPHGGRLRTNAYTHAMGIAREIGDTREEQRLLESFIEAYPGEDLTISARRRLVRLHLSTGDPVSALARIEDLTGRSDEPAVEDQALYVMALYRAGRIEEAMQRRAALEGKLNPDAPLMREITIEQAKYYYDANDFKSAADALADLSMRCAGDSICEEGLYIYSMSLIAQDQIEDGVRKAQLFFDKYPFSPLVPRLHLKLGNVLSLKFKRYNDALMHYREAATAAKDSAIAFESLKHMAISFQTLSRWDEAERVWAEVLERFPDSPFTKEASLNAARCKMESGNYTGAIEAYNTVLPLLDGEDRARAYYWTGVCHQTLGDFQSAIVDYLKVPYLLPGEAMWAVTSQLKAAECYAAIERYEAARKVYENVIDRYGAGSNWGKVAREALAGLDSAKPKGEKGGGGEE